MATIIAGWDGSEAADRALDTAARLAGPGDTLIAVTVVPAPLAERSFLEMLLPDLEVPKHIAPGTFERRARERLDARLKAVATRAAVRPEVRLGDAADEILSVVEAAGADHVVVGYKSFERHLRFDLGSVAEKLVRYAPCAVTIVRWPDARDP